jgi:alanyl-tRNA synthetase
VLGIKEVRLAGVVESIVAMYEEQYPELRTRADAIVRAIDEEESKFRTTITRGMREFEKLVGTTVSGSDAFVLFSTYGFPLEMTVELARERGMDVDVPAFQAEMEHHQELSRAGAQQKFKGGLADAGEVTTMLHTCTHLMLAGLRKYLGDHVHQAGSNITQERTRFDFTHGEKVPRDILDKVEAYVNEAIGKHCSMNVVTMKKEDAKAQGVEGSFWEKYPDEVTVYQLQADDGTVYSRELCGGPHVHNTGDIKGVFRIVKEEASSAGVRRVKGVLQTDA